MKKLLLAFLLFYVTFQHLVAQDVNTDFTISGSGFLSEDEVLPFWIVSNQNGALANSTNALFEFSGRAKYSINPNSHLEAGASLFARDDVNDEFQRKELYLSYIHKFFRATAGSKAPGVDKKGLSTVNKDFILSGNARPLPGLIIEANNPIALFEDFQIDWGVAHYELNDERFVIDAMVHYKRLGVIWDISDHGSLHFGIEHYAQWGGNSPERGEQPGGLGDFWDILLAKRAGDNSSDTDIRNALGNHLGIYNFEYRYVKNKNIYRFYHQHPFEDGSGTALKNLPDGIWGFYFEPNTVDFTTFIDGFLVEYVQTTNQSGSRMGGSARDNYFNSGVYRSGWSYEGNILGLPFITLGPSGIIIDNNRLRAIHLGLSASHKRWSFKTKVSLVENIGNFAVELDPSEKGVYSMLQTTYDLQKLGEVTAVFGYDYSDLFTDRFGGGLTYTYSF